MKQFGTVVNRLIDKEDLSYDETYSSFKQVIFDQPTQMHQGSYLAALTAKGATNDEITAVYDCILEYDTNTVQLNTQNPVVDNSGTGMDRIKTFNISSPAAIIAAAAGAVVARHGSRGISSPCGAVDILEKLGVGVEVPVDTVKFSIEQTGIGIFNGMSPQVHPQALGRILGNISYASVLNIAASLANPARPTYAVRGVSEQAMVRPVAELMDSIGYKRAIVVHGLTADGSDGIDEAGNIGKTVYSLLNDGQIVDGSFVPSDFNMQQVPIEAIRTYGDIDLEEQRFLAILNGTATQAEADIVALNAALILYITGIAPSIQAGITLSQQTVASGAAYQKLEAWRQAQN
jgi:anthranilate phosphoribosyltransferase